MIYNTINHRKTQKQKNSNNFEYYRNILDSLSVNNPDNIFTFDNPNSRYNKLKINYDLYNNKIDVNEFNYVCKPFGESDQGELPANMVNRDIISGKIKAVEAMEIVEPFDFNVIAVNEEATTRKEQEVFERLKQYTIDSVMLPIKAQVEQEFQAALEGREELPPEELQQIQAQMEEEIKARTPDEVYKYMEREHQDPAEMLAVHLLNYLIYKENFKRKTNKGWKHACLSAHEIYYIGHDSDLQPSFEVVNPLKVSFDDATETEFIEDLDWFAVEKEMTTNDVIKLFGSELTDKEIDELYEKHANYSFDALQEIGRNSGLLHTVQHAVWVSLRKIGFLVYIDEQGEPQETIVSEEYELDEKNGDVEISWSWIPEVHEGYKINEDMYKRCGPVLGQVVDIDNLYKHKLPYCGAIYDNMNSEPVSLVDRMKHYQYYYNIIMYRIEMLMASDKGKILLMNIDAIPKSAGIDLKKFLYYMESLKIGFYNPKEEGRKESQDAGSIAKEIDMSLASDIQKYIALADYIERRCGESVGITKQIEGQTDHRESVRNAQMNYQQSSGILQTYYDLHNIVKKNLLEILLEKTKALFALNPMQKKLQYILDDMTLVMFEIDFDLLDNSTYGIFLSNSTLDKQAKEAVKQLAHAAMQNDKANLKDISKILRSTSVQEGEELLEKAEKEAQERAERLEQMRAEAMERERQEAQKFRREEHEMEKELIILKEKEKRETEIQKALVIGTGFQENKDMDKDGVPDILEVAKFGVDADIKIKKQKLEEEKLKHQIEKDNQQTAIMKQKIVKT